MQARRCVGLCCVHAAWMLSVDLAPLLQPGPQQSVQPVRAQPLAERFCVSASQETKLGRSKGRCSPRVKSQSPAISYPFPSLLIIIIIIIPPRFRSPWHSSASHASKHCRSSDIQIFSQHETLRLQREVDAFSDCMTASAGSFWD